MNASRVSLGGHDLLVQIHDRSNGTWARRDAWRIQEVPVWSRWLLLEHPEPWRDRAGAEDAVGHPELWAAARARRVRINLIRRQPPGRVDSPPRSFVVSAAPGRGFVEQWPRAELFARLPHALDAVVAGAPSGAGTTVTEPLYLVCTHGYRTAACGGWGPSVHRAVAAEVGGRAWETTHVGGCNLAVNLVCLPSGAYYSRVTPADVPIIVSDTEQGRITLSRYRGSGGLPADMQAAELAVRRLTGIDTVGGVRPLGRERMGLDATCVAVATDDETYRVTLGGRTDKRLGYEVISTTVLR